MVAGADDAGSRAPAARAAGEGTRVVTYGEAVDAAVLLSVVRLEGTGSTAVVRLPDDARDHVLELRVPGLHNAQNATAAFVAATVGLGLEPGPVLAGLAAFRGTRRRFEAMGQSAGVRIVDDYAHNPGKVAAVVTTAARIASPGRLVVVFQPHLFSRTRDFADDFGAALAEADVVVVMDVYAAREDPMPGVSGALVAEAARAHGAPYVVFVPDDASVPDLVVGLLAPGDLLLTVGAGDVTRIGPAVLARLQDGAHA